MDNGTPPEAAPAMPVPAAPPRLFLGLAALIALWSLWLVLAFPAWRIPGNWYYLFCAADVAFTAAGIAGLVRVHSQLISAYVVFKIALAVIVAAIPGAPGTAQDLLLATWVVMPAVLVAAGIIFATEEEEFDVADAAAELPVAGAGDWFTPSMTKLLVMDLATLGLYKIYWHYRQWANVKRREGTDIMPFWRAVFSPVWLYFLLQRMAQERSRLGLPGMPAGLIALLYLALVFTYLVPPPWDLLGSVLTVVPILMANRHAMTLNEATGGAVEGRFSALNVAGIVIGAILWLLIIVGTFFVEVEA
jgi:hypothetical protein